MTWASDPKLRDGLHKPKFYETGFPYLPEAHELRGKNRRSARAERRPAMAA